MPNPFNSAVEMIVEKIRSGNVRLSRKFSGMQKIRYAQGKTSHFATCQP